MSLRIKGTTIFGQYMGTLKTGKTTKVIFLDEETHELKQYAPSKLEKSYDKDNWWQKAEDCTYEPF